MNFEIFGGGSGYMEGGGDENRTHTFFGYSGYPRCPKYFWVPFGYPKYFWVLLGTFTLGTLGVGPRPGVRLVFTGFAGFGGFGWRRGVFCAFGAVLERAGTAGVRQSRLIKSDS